MTGQRKKWSTSILLVCSASLALSSLAGCGKSDGEPAASAVPSAGVASPGGATAAPTQKEEPFKLSIMMMQNGTELPKADNVILKALEEATNTKLEFSWVPQAQIDEKTNLVLASGDMPQLMYIQSFKSPSILNAVKVGAFWEMGPHLKDYPNLAKADPGIMNNISVDGKNYAMYRYVAPAQVGVLYRKDWLEALNLQQPKTVDDFYNMLKAFKLQDPDKDGKEDTYGMVYWKESFLAMFRILALWHGSPNQWGEDKDGKITADFTTNEYMQALKFMKKLYDEKLINQDFAVMTNATANDMFLDGTAGSVFATAGNLTSFQKNEKIKNQNGQLDLASTLEGGYGPRARAGTGYVGTYMIPKKSVKTEAEFKRIMQFLDDLNSQKVQNLLKYGIEGRHYKVENGVVVNLEGLPAEQQFTKEVLDLRNLMLRNTVNELPAKLSAVEQRAEDIKAENEKSAVYNLVEPYISETYTKQGQQLDTMRYDMMVKFVMGQLDEAGYKAEVDKWLKAGGDTVIKELNEQYQAFKKK
ncbi:MAG: extracellular solute-binding protein family 1 [Paenibacillaceae bacterium]|jgi:putative aldouronate transport system substrate-binding protein|nr:extracellular solute-binding protein family 1 [Paenibacillaceae bacterium]